MSDPRQIEMVGVGAIMLIAICAVTWQLCGRRSARIGKLAVAGSLALLLFSLVASQFYQRVELPVEESSVVGRPVRLARNGYVGSEKCKSCHAEEHRTWHASYHRTMTQVASEASVLGDFNDVTLTMKGVNYLREYKLSQEDGEYWVGIGPVFHPETDATRPAAELKRHKIVMTTGSHHMQTYWYDSGVGRVVGILPFVYLLDEERWVPRYAAFIRSPHLPADEPPGRWNATCIRCHTTNGILGTQQGRTESLEEAKSVETTVAEFGISCEACHGPGEEHVRLNQNPARRYQLHLTGQGDPTLVHPERLNSKLATHVCAQCHSSYFAHSKQVHARWNAKGMDYQPGDDLHTMRFIVRHDQEERPSDVQHVIDEDPLYLDGTFWPDGMIRVAGREYNGMLNTPCFSQGSMTCLSCHTLHKKKDDPRSLVDWANDQLGHQMDSNQACTQCHKEYRRESTLLAHTHHKIDSSGSQCMNCHMPHTTYGLLKGIRSHTITSPTADESLKAGRPNACNLCHLDRTLDWTAEHLRDQYGQPKPTIPQEHQDIAASLVWILQGDAAQRAIVAWHMGWPEAQAVAGDQWMAPHVATLLNDPYAAIRLIAQRTLEKLPGTDVGQVAKYDLTDHRNARIKSLQGVLRHWYQWEKNENHEWPARLLIHKNGRLDLKRVMPLLKNRDDKPMLINE